MSAATPPPRPWTVGDLRQALAGVPDDTPLRVDTAIDDDFSDEQVVVGAGFSEVIWQGEVETDVVLSIACEFPSEDWPYRSCRYGTYRQTALDDSPAPRSSSDGARAPDTGGFPPPPVSGPGAAIAPAARTVEGHDGVDLVLPPAELRRLLMAGRAPGVTVEYDWRRLQSARYGLAGGGRR